MIFFEIVGVITCAVIVWRIAHGMYRKAFPVKYTWNTCPNDHDTMARYGQPRCEKCGNDLQ